MYNIWTPGEGPLWPVWHINNPDIEIYNQSSLYLAHHFYMPGIWNPVKDFFQRKFVTIYSKVCNNVFI